LINEFIKKFLDKEMFFLKVKNTKIIEYLFYFFIFLLPWQTRWIFHDSLIGGEIYEYGRLSLYGFDVVFIILLFCHLINLVTSKVQRDRLLDIEVKSNYGRKLLVVCCLLTVFCFLSILQSPDKLVALFWSLRFAQGLILIWLIQKINFNQLKAVFVFVISVSLSSLLGVYNFVVQEIFASKWLGLADHSAANLGDSVIETGGLRVLRAYGSLPHPNILAGFAIIAFIAVFWLRVLLDNRHWLKRLSADLMIFTLTIAIFLSFSRAAWLIYSVMIVLILINNIIKKTFTLNKSYLRLALYSLVIFASLSIILSPLMKTRVGGNERLEIKSTQERLAGYQDSLELLKNNWVLGVGIGNYTQELQNMYPGKPAWFYQPVHNTYLLVLSELGLIGAITIILIFVIIFVIKKQELRSKKLSVVCCLPAGKAGLLFVVICLLFFDHYFWTIASGLLLFFMIIAYCYKFNASKI